MTTLHERPAYHLTRHFFNGLFGIGFLSEVGADSFKRMIIGLCAALLTFGLLLVRVFARKYAHLSALNTAEPYREALLADHAFIIALPMWIVAFVTVLVGHSLFPDETDFRVLMGLPVTQRLVFGTKLLALALFAGLFILSAHVALVPLFALTSMGRWANHAFPLQLAAYGIASLLASGFSILAVTAVHGLLSLAMPPGRLLAASAALRSAMICVLVLSLPLVLRLPGQARPFADASSWLYVAPPAWFLGLERWLLGDEGRAHLIRLAEIAGGALTLATALAAGSYAVLYRRFDRLLLRPAEVSERSLRHLKRKPWSRAVPSRPVFVAIRRFTLITLRRSVLHQGIVVALAAVGGGLVANSLMAADVAGWLANGGALRSGLFGTVIWAPFALMFVASLAVRLALAVPIEPRANWVFRIAEQDVARRDQLEAAVHAVRRLGTIVPVVLLAPLQWLVLGGNAIVASMVALLCGWLLVEILMRDWVRIPFTCSYIPGKGFVPQTILTGLVSFITFTTAGALLVRFSLTSHPASLALNAMLFTAVFVLRRRRVNMWKRTPLAFDDELPTEVNPLRLSSD
jgi:hypothetical protein